MLYQSGLCNIFSDVAITFGWQKGQSSTWRVHIQKMRGAKLFRGKPTQILLLEKVACNHATIHRSQILGPGRLKKDSAMRLFSSPAFFVKLLLLLLKKNVWTSQGLFDNISDSLMSMAPAEHALPVSLALLRDFSQVSMTLVSDTSIVL